MTQKRYMVLLVDRKRALMFTLLDGMVEDQEEFIDGQVPQKVKHGDNTWDAQDKIYRHIEDHLHRHLQLVMSIAASFAKKNHISGLIIGGHKELFVRVKRHLPYPLKLKLKGEFISELKCPFNEILKKAETKIQDIENPAI